MTSTEVFEYPHLRHERRHGPIGYIDYRSFKPWLRDDFMFRCIYCLWRETWCADAEGAFSVDHVRPCVSHPELECDYDNLAYACCRCNAIKQDSSLPSGPFADGWSRHLSSAPDGMVRGTSVAGQRIVEICRLNRPALVEARRRMFAVLKELAASGTQTAKALLRELLSFPSNLPVLSNLNPPGGNARPERNRRELLRAAKARRVARNVLKFKDRVRELTAKYFHEMGNSGYAALNVLTDFATEPASYISQEAMIDPLQKRCGDWTVNFLAAVKDSKFDYASYLGPCLETAEALSQSA